MGFDGTCLIFYFKKNSLDLKNAFRKEFVFLPLLPLQIMLNLHSPYVEDILGKWLNYFSIRNTIFFQI